MKGTRNLGFPIPTTSRRDVLKLSLSWERCHFSDSQQRLPCPFTAAPSNSLFDTATTHLSLEIGR